MNPITRTLLTALLILCTVSFAHAKRVALVMGNDNYTAVTKLQKAGNDADAMARELRAAGFTVQLQKNLNYRSMVKVVESFANGITGGDEVVVFFAGHGVQIRSGSYLLPIDIEADSESQVEKTAYGINDLTEKLSEAKAAFALVVIDACRDNPLKTKGRSIGATRGLSAVEPAKGQMIVYSASRGQQALDRLSDRDPSPNGVFTREFIARMKKPGVRIEDMVREVQDAVETLAKTVSHEQRPALYNEARGNFYFYGPTTVQVAPQSNAVPKMTQAQKEEKFWDDAKAAGNKEAYEAYLESYPAGRYVSLAKANIARLSPVNASPVVAQTANRSPGTVFKDCPDCPEMVVIPAGRFVMGAAPGEEESEKLPDNLRNRSQPQHGVDVASFSAGKFEITRGQYRAFAEETGRSSAAGCYVWTGSKFEIDQAKDWRNPGYAQDDPHPVSCVSWDDAKAYTVWLSQKAGKGYRLLTEAEWEYAARAGTTTRRFWGDEGDQPCAYANGADQTTKTQVPDWKYLIANCNDRYAYTAPVGSYRANAFGLYDMLGNVYEWTEDCWNENYSGAPTDGNSWTTGNCYQRVVRGGSWNFDPRYLRSAYRLRNSTAIRYSGGGFRVARTD